MTIFNTFKPTIVILLAAGVVILVVLPIAETDLADAVRTGFSEHHPAPSKPNLTGSTAAIAPALLKATVLIGVPGAITILFRTNKRRQTKGKFSSKR